MDKSGGPLPVWLFDDDPDFELVTNLGHEASMLATRTISLGVPIREDNSGGQELLKTGVSLAIDVLAILSGG